MRITFLFFCLLFAFTPKAQIQGKKIKSTAAGYFEKGKYVEALNLYQKYLRIDPQDNSIFSPLGISYLETGNIEQGLRYLRMVVGNSKKPENSDLFYLARAYHMSAMFKEAAEFYKSYLANSDDKDDKRRMVKDMIRRCGMGLRLSMAEEIAVVENLGESVNSQGDDTAPLISPNYSNKLYFSSVRFGNTGGMRDEEGKSDELYGSYKTDLFSSYEKSGKWTVPEQLPGLLNSPRNDLILDFTNNGQVMIFFKGNDLVSGEILVDSFTTTEQNLFSKSFQGPLDPEKGDVSLHFYNDSILVFASRMAGGYGGLDLHISTWSNNQWSTPKNLGPKINSSYDETTPFLTKDGRTLYFSSNNPKSIGAHDVFMAKYRDDNESWDDPINLASPINSPGDDTHFRITEDGLKAYFSSSRKGGFGGNDIYVTYFKKKRSENLVSSRPITFDQVTAYKRSQRDAGILEVAGDPIAGDPFIVPNESGQPVKKYKFRPLYINQNDQVLGPGNIQELDKISQFMASYPGCGIVLRGHGDGNSPDDFKLYFSMKRVEKAAEYLTSKGVRSQKIYLQGFGDQFPIIKNRIESGPQINADKFNRRIDYEFVGLPGNEVQIEMEKQKVRENFFDTRGLNFRTNQNGLFYRVQVAAIGQNYYLPEKFREQEWIIEKSGNFNGYRYQLGRFNTFQSAHEKKNQLIGSGIAGAFVVPYLNGLPLKRSDSMRLIEQYPDLQYYLSDSPR